MLDEASLVLSSALQPALDEMDCLVALDLLAGECPTPTADGVAKHLFDTLAFTGNRNAYYDWRNSCLDRVVATRVGIPISLSILMIEVARRVGVPLVGVGMPAHFLVRSADDAERVLRSVPRPGAPEPRRSPDDSSKRSPTVRPRGATST